MCLYNKNSLFAFENLLQTNVTVSSAPNLSSYSDITLDSLDHAIMEQKETAFKELFCSGR